MGVSSAASPLVLVVMMGRVVIGWWQGLEDEMAESKRTLDRAQREAVKEMEALVQVSSKGD